MKKLCNAFCMCYSMFTALPCPYRPWDEKARGLMLVCLPIVGALLGLLWTGLAALGRMALAPTLNAALVAALPWLLTGFIHLDGYMDTCDAILSWRPLEQRLRILKDVHTGAFAVVGLGILMMFSYASAVALAGDDLRPLLFIPVVSRCGSAFCVLTLKPIGHSEYAATEGKGGQRIAVAVIWFVAMVACWIWLGRAVIVLALQTLAYALAMLWGYRTLKGVSGDVAGFALTVSECAALMALANLRLWFEGGIL